MSMLHCPIHITFGTLGDEETEPTYGNMESI